MISPTARNTSTKFAPFLSFAKFMHGPFSYTYSNITQNLTSFYSNLITHFISINSLSFAEFLHARLIKIGFHRHTFLGNRLVDLYFQFGAIEDASRAFHDIPRKNLITWNLLLMGYFKIGCIENARQVFDKMTERDVITWNSLISGYASNGAVECALDAFLEMQVIGMRPNEYTFSIIVSCINFVCQAKQIHGCIIRSGLSSSNVVLGNSLIDMYGKLNLVEYAFSVFLTMEELDVISWNSIISGCEKAGHGDQALYLFSLMLTTGFIPDEFTVSTVITVCSNLRDLEKD